MVRAVVGHVQVVITVVIVVTYAGTLAPADLVKPCSESYISEAAIVIVVVGRGLFGATVCIVRESPFTRKMYCHPER